MATLYRLTSRKFVDFSLKMKTNFKDIDFPDNTLSPSNKLETDDGWDLTWSYKNLLSGYQIAMVMPEKLQPGPLAGRISLFAPVSLFFFFLMIIITTMHGIELHPMNYVFLAAVFFSFHLLLAYRVDHVSIHLAFAISAAVSVFLVVSYLRLVVGMHFASREAAPGTVHLPGDVLLCVLPQGLYWLGNHNRVSRHFICCDAGDGADSLGGQVFPEAGRATGRRTDLMLISLTFPR